MTPEPPDRATRNKAWTVLSRQASYLSEMADGWQYMDKNRDAAKAARAEAKALISVADWLREIA